MTTLPANIKIGYPLSFITELYFPVAVWFFYYSRFLSVQEIAVLTGFQIIIWNLFEVPTGAFADLVGRKKTIILAFLIYALAMFATAFTTRFWVFMVIEFFKGLSNALNSGSLEALLYDSLKERSQENFWDQVVANNESLLWLGLFLASVAGGFLFYFWPPLPYLVQGFIYLLAMFLAFRLVEPKIERAKSNLKQMLTQNIRGFQELFRSLAATHKTLILALIGTGYMIAANILGISQAKEYGLDSRAVGILFGTGYLISAAASQAYPKLKHFFGAQKLMVILAVILLSTFLLADIVGVIFGAVLIVFRISSSTTFRNVKSSLVNGYISSKNRATALSAMQLLTQLPYAIGAYSIGAYIDTHSPNQFALLLGLILVVLSGLTHLGYLLAAKH